MGSAIVIGAGIGGLTAGLALAAEGWEVQVLERAPAFGHVGSCIAVGPNALRALDTIPGGVADELRALALPPVEAGMRTARGRWLLKQDLAHLKARYGDTLVPVERAVIIDLLASRLPAGALRLGAEIADVDPDAGEVTLLSGETLRADLVVGADGMHSPTRHALFPGHPDPVFVGVTCWLLLVPGDGLEVTPGELWGRGAMFGAMPLADGRMYAFAERRADEEYRPRPAAEEKAELVRHFADFLDPVPEIVARAVPEEIIRVDIHSQRRPVPALHRGRVALVGDAGHTMTPNVGQGACQAIEDAVTLAHHAPDLAGYTAARRPRTRKVTRLADTAVRLATADGAFASVRDGGLRFAGLFGPVVGNSQGDTLFRWDPPSDPVRNAARPRAAS